jgi:hypothetical protein
MQPQRALRGEVLEAEYTPIRNPEIEQLRSENATLRAKLQEAQERLIQTGNDYGRMRLDYEAQERVLHDLRRHLAPFYDRLRAVFGELDTAVAASPQTVPTNPIWEAWKKRLGGLPAKAIDVLLLHGELSRTQLRIHLQCATGSVPDIVYKLNQAGLINKNGSKISLKELR